MRLHLNSIGIICALLLILMARSQGIAYSQCDRTCLNGYLDQYLIALETHDPFSLPLADDVRYTENGQTLKLGNGMWGPEILLVTYKLSFADPQTCQAGCFGVVMENDHPQILALRLQVRNKEITDIETIVARSTPESFSEPEALVDIPVFHEALPHARRRSREKLIAITDSYFERLEQDTGGLTPFSDDCVRIENGIITANNPDGEGMQKMTCSEQFNSGFSTFITEIRERRYPIVDEERGLVYATVFFDHAGTVRTVDMTNGMTLTVPPPYDTPYTWMIGELFKIADGKISFIKAVLIPVPYGMPSGWDE